jgi:hypothetical protein
MTEKTPPATQRPARPALMALLRYVLPGAVVVAGLVVMALGSETDLEGGGGIVSAGLAIFFVNWLFRTGAAGDLERQREDEAREYFDRHGHWPDQRPGGGGRTGEPR